jgi:AraC family transcriptional regulator
MTQEKILPKVVEYASVVEGVALGLRWDPKGTLELSGFEDALVCIHVGPAAGLVCRRGGRVYSGTSVQGDIDIIPARTPMRWEMQDQNDTALILSLPPALLQTVADGTGPGAARIELRDRFQIRDSELETLIWAMKREMEAGSPSGRLYLDGLTLAVASRLVARHSSAAKPIEERREGLDGRRLKRVLSFIEDQLAEDLSLEKIAAIVGLSASHLQALFRISMGVPIHQYVIQRRVERAKTLLMQDELSMAQIALAAGFAHQSHMARHMRRMLGVPPRELKRLLAEASAARRFVSPVDSSPR